LVRRTPDSCGVGVITSAEQPSVALTDTLAQTEAIVSVIDESLAEIRNHVERSNSDNLDPAHLRATLEEFLPIWDVLEFAERYRLVHMLLERLEWSPQNDVRMFLRFPRRRNTAG